MWPRLSVNLEYMEPFTTANSTYMSVMQVNASVPMSVLENFGGMTYACYNDTDDTEYIALVSANQFDIVKS